VFTAAFIRSGAAARIARIIAIKWVRALPGSFTVNFIFSPPVRFDGILIV